MKKKMYQMINFRLCQLCKQRYINPLDLPSLGPDTTYPSKSVHLTGTSSYSNPWKVYVRNITLGIL